jgi:hypothetical protein
MQYNTETKTITINQKKGSLYKHINNLPEDAEILIIECLTLNKGETLNNLPTTLKEINIKDLWAVSRGTVKNGMILCHNTSIKDFIKSVFPKIPCGCKIYYEDDE